MEYTAENADMITQKLIARHAPLPSFDGLTAAGIDEAGRGALAGPVVAAAVILPLNCRIEGCDDSKKLTPENRRRLEKIIKNRAAAWAVKWASVAEIERLNILNASLLAMRRALDALCLAGLAPQVALVDGNRFPPVNLPCYAIVKGDARVGVIGAASILAKTARDRQMERLHQSYPAYNFKSHKGYPTAEHLRQLKANGHCAIHRRSYKPVQRQILLETGG